MNAYESCLHTSIERSSMLQAILFIQQNRERFNDEDYFAKSILSLYEFVLSKKTEIQIKRSSAQMIAPGYEPKYCKLRIVIHMTCPSIMSPNALILIARYRNGRRKLVNRVKGNGTCSKRCSENRKFTRSSIPSSQPARAKALAEAHAI